MVEVDQTHGMVKVMGLLVIGIGLLMGLIFGTRFIRHLFAKSISGDDWFSLVASAVMIFFGWVTLKYETFIGSLFTSPDMSHLEKDHNLEDETITENTVDTILYGDSEISENELVRKIDETHYNDSSDNFVGLVAEPRNLVLQGKRKTEDIWLLDIPVPRGRSFSPLNIDVTHEMFTSLMTEFLEFGEVYYIIRTKDMDRIRSYLRKRIT